jgi:hypothetical protein
MVESTCARIESMASSPSTSPGFTGGSANIDSSPSQGSTPQPNGYDDPGAAGAGQGDAP